MQCCVQELSSKDISTFNLDAAQCFMHHGGVTKSKQTPYFMHHLSEQMLHLISIEARGNESSATQKGQKKDRGLPTPNTRRQLDNHSAGPFKFVQNFTHLTA